MCVFIWNSTSYLTPCMSLSYSYIHTWPGNMYRCIWACIGAVCNTRTDSNVSFDSDVPKCAEISYRRKVLPSVANNKLHKRLEQKALHKKSLTKKKCVKGNGWVENICQRHLSIFALVGLQVGVIVLTFNGLHTRPHHSKPHSRHVNIARLWWCGYLSSRPNGIETPGLEICHILPKGKVRKVRFWLRVRKQFRFSILEARKGSAQLVFIAFSSVSDFVLVSLVFVTFM